MAGAINTTVRGKYVTHRPAYWKRPIQYLPTPPPSGLPPVNQVQTPAVQALTFTQASFVVPATGGSITLNLPAPYVGNIRDYLLVQAVGAITTGNPGGNIGDYYVTSITESTVTLLCDTGSAAAGTTVTGATSPLVFANLGVMGPPVYNPVVLSPVQSSALVQGAVQNGVFQGACFASDDAGNPSLVALISQRLFQFLILGNQILCSEIFIYPEGPITPIQPQAWLWQAERWVIVQDGVNNPIFLDLNGGMGVTPQSGVPNFGTAVRSLGMTGSASYATLITEGSGGAVWVIPAIGASFSVTVSSAANLSVGLQVTFLGFGTFQVTTISGLTVTFENINSPNVGTEFSGATIYWTAPTLLQMPPGCMGAYGLGRNWLALPGRITFIAGDIVDGASGTAGYNFRDAVLNMAENSYITGGGTFSIPASGGESIQSIMFLSTLDVSLGQGPVQVFTNLRVFSCNAPVDRLTWQSLTNPILTVALIGAGAEGQNSTVMANGDPLFRSQDGVRSLTFSTINFYNPNNLWTNVPISFEVSPTLYNDNSALLQYGSAIVFDNRFLMTCNPVQCAQGVYFPGLVPINFDTASTIKTHASPVWDGAIWTGMNVLQLNCGEVAGLPRAFAFCLNTSSAAAGIEIYEILPSKGPLAQTNDWNGTALVPIQWQFDSPSLRFKVPKDEHVYMQLSNGEIWVDDMVGPVTFNVQYKPDQFPCWTQWREWTATSSIVCGVPPPTVFPSFPRSCIPPANQRQVYSGVGPPTIIPAVPTAIYSDVTNPTQPAMWLWANSAWTEFIG